MRNCISIPFDLGFIRIKINESNSAGLLKYNYLIVGEMLTGDKCDEMQIKVEKIEKIVKVKGFK